MNWQTAVRPAVPMMDEFQISWRLVATKETHFPVCVVDSQIVLTTQLMQSWASSSILLASPRTTTIPTLPGTPQPVRREEGGLTATTAAAAAASFPPSHLRVGVRGGHSEQRGSQEEAPRSICIFPTLLLLFLLLPLLSFRGLTLQIPFWLPLHFPRVY